MEIHTEGIQHFNGLTANFHILAWYLWLRILNKLCVLLALLFLGPLLWCWPTWKQRNPKLFRKDFSEPKIRGTVLSLNIQTPHKENI